MHPSIEATSSPLHSVAFLFTNAAGGIAFADRMFLRLTKRPHVCTSQVNTLHSVFDLDAHAANKLMEEVALKRFVYYKALSIKTTTGSLKPLYTAGVAAFIEKEIFIGADFMFAFPSPEASPPPPADHSDVLNAYLKQALIESKLLDTGTFLQVCDRVYIEAIQVLLTRIGGTQMRDTLERIINSTAHQHGMPAIMHNGYLEFPDKNVSFNVLRILLRAAVEYAVSATSATLVTNELKMFDRKTVSKLLEFTNLDDLLTENYDKDDSL